MWIEPKKLDPSTFYMELPENSSIDNVVVVIAGRTLVPPDYTVTASGKGYTINITNQAVKSLLAGGVHTLWANCVVTPKTTRAARSRKKAE